MYITIISISILLLVLFFYLKKSKFGKAPKGKALDTIKLSTNFKNGKFQNINYTPNLSEGYSMLGIIYNQVFKKNLRKTPKQTIPSIKTDLLHLNKKDNILVWFGHSSYFMQIDGVNFLVDPVFSGNASPIPGTVKSFNGTDIYSADDLPTIDYLIITHDHYDHVDYQTIIELKNKVKTVICGLGVGSHFEHWGYLKKNIIESDWHKQIKLLDGFTLNTTPTRHFSGRAFSKNNTLWLSYVLQTPSTKIYIGGDSGYDNFFVEIGNKFGPFDLVILDNGQYNMAWREIHMLPEEVIQASKDLKAKRLFPVHSSKFALANHSWNHPLEKITELNAKNNIPLVTPMIGEIVHLDNNKQVFKQWWNAIN